MSTYGLKSIINQPTRFGKNKHGENTATCLDHLYVRNNIELSVDIHLTGISEHVIVEASTSINISAEQTNEGTEKTIYFTNWQKMENSLVKKIGLN